MRGSREAWAFIAFPLAVLMVFTLLPTVAGLALSLFQWDGGGGVGAARWVGLENYRGLLADEDFGPALRNTIIYVVASIAPAVFIAFLVAVAVHARWFRGKAIVRTLLFMPTIVSIVAIGFVWRWVLSDQAGLLNFGMGLVGIKDTPDWLNDRWWPFVWIVVISVWRHIGFCLVLYLAALSTVNESLYDAAEVDGARRWQVVRHITWPQVAPTTVFLLVTGIISAFQVFDLVFIMTGQQENDYTNVLNLMTYRAFTDGQLGYAAAIGGVIFALTLVATALQLGVARWFGGAADVSRKESVFRRWWPGPKRRARVEVPAGGER